MQPPRGRFAPSPTGALHFGSLISAVASFADAKAAGGRWLLRIEDVDELRAVPGAAVAIIDTLGAYGMTSDEPVITQSQRKDAYAAVVEQLLAAGHAFRCGCTRADLPPSGVYPGTCVEGLRAGRRPRTIRLRVPDGPTTVTDLVRGEQTQHLGRDVGAFVIRRADGYFAYQLAVVVDDGWQQIDRIVRGSDLLPSTPRQRHLQRLLGLPAPIWAHHPVAVDNEGRKLSKRWAAVAVDRDDPLPALRAAWRFLGQPSPTRPVPSVAAFWAWALPRWRLDRVPAVDALAAPEGPSRPAAPSLETASR